MIYTYHNNEEDVPVDRVLVFGAELNGYMRRGWGPIAVKKHGAIVGRAMGFSENQEKGGKSFAIAVRGVDKLHLRTKDILRNIDMFLEYSYTAKSLTFHITDLSVFVPRVETGVMAYMFKGAHPNCIFPVNWKEYMEPPENNF